MSRKVINWDKAKQKVVGGLSRSSLVTHDSLTATHALLKAMEDEFRTTWRGNQLELIELTKGIILKWDVRKAKQLIDLFPEHFPVSFHGKTIVAKYNEQSDWVIFPEPPKQEEADGFRQGPASAGKNNTHEIEDAITEALEKLPDSWQLNMIVEKGKVRVVLKSPISEVQLEAADTLLAEKIKEATEKAIEFSNCNDEISLS